MITLKKVETSELQMYSMIKRFTTKHPLICWFSIALIFGVTLLAMLTVLTLAATGGGLFENAVTNNYHDGTITAIEYDQTMYIIHIAAGLWNYLAFVTQLVVGLIVASILYKLYKAYLKYRHDNL